MINKMILWRIPLILSLLWCATVCASDWDEFNVKREAVYEFTSPPKVICDGDLATITFETKGFCDVSVAVEGRDGTILRHLGSGVLGQNAPPPFQKNAKKQQILWDGKDDQGRYIDNKNGVHVRVSLGLKPAFERSLYWEPKKRLSTNPPLFAASPEGMYVFDSKGVDHLRFYDHQGNYTRTIYPFPADKLDKVKGLEWKTYPWGERHPAKLGHQQATLLSSGTSSVDTNPYRHGGIGATTLAVRNGRMALAFEALNRLASDGSTGGWPLKGPKTGYQAGLKLMHGWKPGTQLGPSSSAFSPDGKTLYLTGYLWKQGGTGWVGNCLNGVIKLDYESDAPPKVFAGHMNTKDFGSSNERFCVPTSVACDASGRVYVSDFWNDRIQVFSSEGKFLKSMGTGKPAKVMIHQKTQEIWVCSFIVFGIPPHIMKKNYKMLMGIKPTISRLGTFEQPSKGAPLPLPLPKSSFGMTAKGQMYQVELDSWSKDPVLWVGSRKTELTQAMVGNWGLGTIDRLNSDSWLNDGIRLLGFKNGKWVVQRDFAKETQKSVKRVKPWADGIQRLRVNPKNGKVYVLELKAVAKVADELVVVDPKTGDIELNKMPFNAEDICFDTNGLIYLRTDTEVVRYDPDTWREVPWDYGEEKMRIAAEANAISALPIPGKKPMWFHMGGMWVSPKGNLAVMCPNGSAEKEKRAPGAWKTSREYASKAYTPNIYPGRLRYGEVHVWDKHGKLLYEDALPGITILDGLAIDKDDSLYVLGHQMRMLDGKRYPNKKTGTLMKFAPRKMKVVGTSTQGQKGAHGPFVEQPLPKEAWPAKAPQLQGGGLGLGWVEGANWFYGGAGHCRRAGGGCNCWHSRFTLDLFGRSFVPETERYSVAVLDTNGNLILRVGRYGNVDDKGIGLIYPNYVATHTDRRLFIADPGNARIAGVKLGYHKDVRVALKALPTDSRSHQQVAEKHAP